MATLKNTIKRAEKLSGKTITVDAANLHSVNYKGYTISFYPNGRMEEGVEATNFYVKRADLKDDHMTDYFAGCFQDNITKCFTHVDYMTANN